MDKVESFRIDSETQEKLKELKQTLKIAKSDVMRMSIMYFYNYVKKVSK